MRKLAALAVLVLAATPARAQVQPFVFTLTLDGAGVLLIGSARAIAAASLTACVGLAALAAALTGWIRKPLAIWERAAFLAGGLLLCYGSPASDAAGAVITAVVLFLHFWRYSRVAAVHQQV